MRSLATVATLLASSPQGPPSSAGAAATPAPAFAVASIKRSVPIEIAGSITVRGGALQPGRRWLATNVPLLAILRGAYGSYGQPGQVVGYPSWVEDELYDFDARTETDVTREEMQQMVRALVHERFKLVAHPEKRELQSYVLTRANAEGRLGKGMLPPTDACWGGEPAGAAAEPIRMRPGWVRPCDRRISRRDGAMGLWASKSPVSTLAGMLQGLVDAPVNDRSGITGLFDIEMVFAPDGMLGIATAGDTAAPSLFTALQEQLGLKLERERTSVDVLVVDSVERPTAN